MSRAKKTSIDKAVRLSKRVPHKSAEVMHAAILPTLIRYGDDWYEYQSGAYRHLDDLEVDSETQGFLECATVISAEEYEVEKEAEGEPAPAAAPAEGEQAAAAVSVVKTDVKKRQWFNPKSADVTQVYDALRRKYYRSPDRLLPPAFLEGIGSEFAGTDPKNLISCRNVIVDFTNGRTFKPTDRFFTMTALPLDYDPAAACPLWLAFLNTVFEGNAGLIRLTQQMFGYIISGETKRQKIFFLRGKSRSGKGTMLRIMSMLMGKLNVVSPTIQDLCGAFGRENVVDKSLLIIPELDHTDQRAVNAAAAIMLSISGEDDLDVNRKNKKQLGGVRLVARIMFAGNGSPNFNQHTTAMGNRLLVLPFEVSFVGREDWDLTEKLATELPGILIWAMEGLADLRDEGNFVEPSVSVAAKAEVLNSGDPTRGFVADRCELDPDATARKDDLFAEYVSYCKEAEARPLNRQKFFAALKTHFPTVRPARLGSDGDRTQVYVGIGLREEDPKFLMLPIRVDGELLRIGFAPMEAIVRTGDGGLVPYNISEEADFGP